MSVTDVLVTVVDVVVVIEGSGQELHMTGQRLSKYTARLANGWVQNAFSYRPPQTSGSSGTPLQEPGHSLHRTGHLVENARAISASDRVAAIGMLELHSWGLVHTAGSSACPSHRFTVPDVVVFVAVVVVTVVVREVKVELVTVVAVVLVHDPHCSGHKLLILRLASHICGVIFSHASGSRSP